MHPTIFQLDAFGTSRLPPAPTRAVLLHLRRGCARCRAALAPRLIPWMDCHPAAEAAATSADRCDRTLAAAYLRAAVRTARAATTRRPLRAPEGRTRQALAILDAAGPASVGRLPRHLLGLPAVEALLHQTYTLGPADPRLRRRLAELANDLAEGTRADDPRLRQVRCQAMIDLANAHRVALDLCAAQRQLDQAAEEIARGGIAPPLKARLLHCQAAVYNDQSRPLPARAAIAAAKSIYRRQAQPAELARALVLEGKVLGDVLCDLLPARACLRQALLLLEPGEEPLVTSAAFMGLCATEMRLGNWREALAKLRPHLPSLLTHDHGANRARIARLEGELLGHDGDVTGSDGAFACSRREFEAIAQPYEAGIVTLIWAACQRRRGDLEAAQALVAEATESMLRLDPHREVHAALMILRTANRFSETRAGLPLEPIAAFLDHAEFNPSIRLQSYLA
ncbi:MAG TPA: hypothetical protein VOA80_06575 [Thermoanaerobaculia bacterium]|nr:hypothetical protein [Thermoanaerobaculia bacterium]